MIKFIESEFILLREGVDEMWALVYSQLGRAGETVMTLDEELAQQVMVRERRVNAFELKIDSDIEGIIVLYSPVVIDLRFVLIVLKINVDLKRLRGFAEGIARLVIRCKEPVPDTDLLARLRSGEIQVEVSSMLELAERVLNEENTEMATMVFGKNNPLDDISAGATGILAGYVRKHLETVHTRVDLVGVFHELERPSNHITSITEEIVFSIDARVLEHSGRVDENYPKS